MCKWLGITCSCPVNTLQLVALLLPVESLCRPARLHAQVYAMLAWPACLITLIWCLVCVDLDCCSGNVIRSDIISLAGVDTIPGTSHMLVAELLSTQGELDVCGQSCVANSQHTT